MSRRAGQERQTAQQEAGLVQDLYNRFQRALQDDDVDAFYDAYYEVEEALQSASSGAIASLTMLLAEQPYNAAFYGAAKVVEAMAHPARDDFYRFSFAPTTPARIPLHAALLMEYPNVASLLIGYGENLEAVDAEGQHALHIAARFGQRSAIRDILRYPYVRVSPDVRTVKTNKTPLHTAAAYNQAAIIRTLVRLGATLDALDDANNTPLYVAIRARALRATRELLQLGANPLVINERGYNALHMAARHDFIEGAELLLQLPAVRDGHVNDGDAEDGHTALHIAAQHSDNPEFVTLLLRNGADVDAGPQRIPPALIMAVRGRNEPIALRLLENGANAKICLLVTNAKTGETVGGETPLILAIQHNRSLALIRALIASGDRLNSSCGDTLPLLTAIRAGNIGAAVTLLAAGADVNIVDPKSKRLPLTYALVTNQFEIFRMLLGVGANLALRDATGQTPTDVLLKFAERNPSTYERYRDVAALYPSYRGPRDIPIANTEETKAELEKFVTTLNTEIAVLKRVIADMAVKRNAALYLYEPVVD